MYRKVSSAPTFSVVVVLLYILFWSEAGVASEYLQANFEYLESHSRGEIEGEILTRRKRAQSQTIPKSKGKIMHNTGVLKKSTNDNDEVLEGRIIGGEVASKDEVTYQVAVQDVKVPMCGGTILTSEIVISAAHCFYDKNKLYSNAYLQENITIVAGEHNYRKNESTRQSSRIRKLWIHPKYTLKDQIHDIAVVRLESPYNITDFVLPLSMGNPPFEPVPNTSAVVSGWGYTKARFSNKEAYVASEYPDDLQYTWVNVVAQEECIKFYEDKPRIRVLVERNDTLCAQGGVDEIEGANYTTDSCQGDSGGPLACIDPAQNDTMFFCGIVSVGYGCGIKRRPVIYTKVSAFNFWIQEKINETVKPGALIVDDLPTTD